MTSRQQVNDAHARAPQFKEKYHIRQVLDVQDMYGIYSFYFEDLDHNGWEIQYYKGRFANDDYFDFGDRFEMEAATAEAAG